MKGFRKSKQIRYRVSNGENIAWFHYPDGSYSNMYYTTDWGEALRTMVRAGPGSDITWYTKKFLRKGRENYWTYENEMEYQREQG